MGKREDKRLEEFCSKYGYNPDRKKEPPQKIVNLETVKYGIGTKVLEIGGGLIAEVSIIDEYKGIGVFPLNRGEASKEVILYSSQEDFERRIENGHLQVII